jgi:hypothetical protein
VILTIFIAVSCILQTEHRHCFASNLNT